MSVGEDRMQFRSARRILVEAAQTGLIPGAVAAVGRGRDLLWTTVVGNAVQWAGQVRPMQRETLFDMASLTKVVATLPAILRLMLQGDLTLLDPLTRFFPDACDERHRSITVERLLTHSSGLPSSRPYYETCCTLEEMVELILREPLVCSPGTRVIYSDLGFILLGCIVKRVSGLSFDRFCENEVFQPLGMRSTVFCPPELNYDRCAATEVFDNHPLIGVVHDENARATGGVAGHAGLFSTVDDMARYLAMWTGSEPDVLGPWTRAASVSLRTRGLDGNRGWGWVLREDSHDCSGDLWPASAVSHTGFTGTSLVFDPVSGGWAILLTNRVHLGRSKNVANLRKRFHNAVAAVVTD